LITCTIPDALVANVRTQSPRSFYIGSGDCELTFRFFLFLRYVDQGGNTALQDNEDRITELKGRAEKLKMDKEAVSNEIDKLKNDISKQQVSLVHYLFSNSMSCFQWLRTTTGAPLPQQS